MWFFKKKKKTSGIFGDLAEQANQAKKSFNYNFAQSIKAAYSTKGIDFERIINSDEDAAKFLSDFVKITSDVSRLPIDARFYNLKRYHAVNSKGKKCLIVETPPCNLCECESSFIVFISNKEFLITEYWQGQNHYTIRTFAADGCEYIGAVPVNSLEELLSVAKLTLE